MKEELKKIINLTYYKAKARYRNTIAGFLWVIINPILYFVVQAIIFKSVLKIDITNYSTFLCAGILPWFFLTSSISMTTNIFISSRDLLLSFKINPVSLVVSTILDNMMNFLLSFLILFLCISFYEPISLVGIWTLPISLITLVVGVSLLSLLLALLQVFYRDTIYLVGFANSILYFVTPIFYPIERIPEEYQFLINFNPYYGIIRPFKETLWSFDIDTFWMSELISLGWIVLFMLMIKFLWRRKNHEFYLNI